MTSGVFAELVRREFAFLERDYGFRHSWTRGYSVRFDSQRAFVAVGYDATQSYELGLWIGLQAGIQHDVECPFELAEILRAVAQEESAKAVSCIQTREVGLQDHLQHLAGLLRQHGSDLLDGSVDGFNALRRQRDAECAAYAAEREASYARKNADRAWSKGDYHAVVQELAPLKDSLTRSEQVRLAIAQKRVDNQ